MTRLLAVITLLCIAYPSALVVEAQDDSARAQQVAALAGSREPDAIARLRQALADANWYVRGVAAGVIGRRADKSDASLLLPLIRDKHWFVRDEAVAALASLGGAPDNADFIDLLNSSDAYTRAGAASALGTLKQTAGTEMLIKALADDEEVVRRSAARALGELKASSAVSPLIALLRDQDAGVRRASAAALGRIGDARAAPAINEARKTAADGDWEYAAALYRLGDREQIEGVTAALASEKRV